METYETWVGKKVAKNSGRPFKSTYKVNTVRGLTINAQDPKQRVALVFEEDNSTVNACLCYMVENESSTSRP